MAEVPKDLVVKDTVEKLWIQRALIGERERLLRGRAKEIAGSDIWHLRGKELEFLNALIARF